MKTYMLFIMLCIPFAGCELPRNVKVTVVEESGEPIEGAEVLIGFVGYTNDKDETGVTDDQGVFETSGIADLRILARVNKEGYYETEKDRLSRKLDHDLTLILRKKLNPISLYAKDEGLRMPVNRAWIGYDFERGDWVEPHGKGDVADLYFRCDTEVTGRKDGKGTLEIKFEDGGGLIPIREKVLTLSEMKMPHHAPREEYVETFLRREDSFRNKNKEPDKGYFFRTRVEKVGEKITSARYGKIFPDINFYPVMTQPKNEQGLVYDSYATVTFTYYFNPTPNDRNLEFDTKQNLLEGLDTTEKVRHP